MVTEESGWGNGAVIVGDEFRVQLPEGVQGRLMAWWLNTSLCDFQAGAPKVDEYGAHDLEVMGFAMGLLAWKKPKVALPVAVELSVWFYVLGKVARLLSDYMAERPGKGDTWHDITYYSMMARRVQETGRWP